MGGSSGGGGASPPLENIALKSIFDIQNFLELQISLSDEKNKKVNVPKSKMLIVK